MHINTTKVNIYTDDPLIWQGKYTCSQLNHIPWDNYTHMRKVVCLYFHFSIIFKTISSHLTWFQTGLNEFPSDTQNIYIAPHSSCITVYSVYIYLVILILPVWQCSEQTYFLVSSNYHDLQCNHGINNMAKVFNREWKWHH